MKSAFRSAVLVIISVLCGCGNGAPGQKGAATDNPRAGGGGTGTGAQGGLGGGRMDPATSLAGRSGSGQSGGGQSGSGQSGSGQSGSGQSGGGQSGGRQSVGGQSGDAGNPGSDLCAQYTDITEALKAGSYSGIATGDVADTATCFTGTGPKAFLHYKAASAGNVRIDVTSAKAASDPTASDAVVYVRGSCSAYTSEVACNTSAATKPTYAGLDIDYSTLKFTGDTYIVVAGKFYDQGFTLKISYSDSCLSDGDCTNYEDAQCNVVAGICRTTVTCPNKTADCDGNTANACETDLDTDAGNCARCGMKCPTTGTHANGAICTAGVCGLTCESGFGDCNQVAADGCEVQTTSDPANCGECGHSCQGAFCVASVCGTPPNVVAAMPENDPLRGLAIDGSYAYTCDYNGYVYKANLDGSAAAVALTAAPVVDTGLTGIIVAGTDVLVTNENQIWRIPTAGGSAEPIVTLELGTTVISTIVADATGVYFATAVEDGNTTYYLAPNAATPSVIDNRGSGGMLINNGFLYYVAGENWVRFSTTGGGTPTTVGPGGGMIVMSGSSIMITTPTPTAASATTLFSMLGATAIADGTFTQVFPSNMPDLSTYLWDMAYDQPGDSLYVLAGNSSAAAQGIYQVPLHGGSIKQINTLQTAFDISARSTSHSLMTDAKNVYWINENQILSQAK